MDQAQAPTVSNDPRVSPIPSPRMFKEYFQYKGISFPRLIYSEQGLREVENKFQVRDDDVFNVTYQKSGTVWMLEILSLIHSNGDPSRCRTVPNWDRGPWYETVLGLQTARSNQPPRLISSHLPIQLFAKSFFQSKAKVLYTVRNPKDVFVSLYHFAQIFRPYKEPGQLDQFLEQFLEGDVPFGSWFDHVKGWMGLRGHENFFWISYEELQQDLRGSVERICRFLGKQLDAQAMDGVVENASFQAMKQNKMSNFSLAPRFLLDQTHSSFLRKGIAGDWKNQLTTAQSENFDRVYREQMQGLELSFPWDELSPQPSPPPTPGGS
uniref:Sulfotransferase n=1 Tax=Gopherus agassizii TaxID=38772 RepID=A0A452HZE2_9SAUR